MEKITVAQVVRKCLAFYETQMYIDLFIKSRKSKTLCEVT